eukprot:Lithocolla_globosa_v1_NODE_1081_length_2888_cov_9.438758.p2 type:complete len:144 gc:universal NODE_1081_length_2888_cov_9.438758:2254-2685(+)
MLPSGMFRVLEERIAAAANPSSSTKHVVTPNSPCWASPLIQGAKCSFSSLLLEETNAISSKTAPSASLSELNLKQGRSCTTNPCSKPIKTGSIGANLDVISWSKFLPMTCVSLFVFLSVIASPASPKAFTTEEFERALVQAVA